MNMMNQEARGMRHEKSHGTHLASCVIPPVSGRAQRGMTTLLVVGFMGVFMLILGTVTGYAFQQAKYGRAARKS